MNSRYLPAGIIVAICTVISVVALNSLNARAANVHADLGVAKLDLQEAQNKSIDAKAKLANASAGSKQVDQFLGSWGLYAEEGNALGGIVDKLSKLAYERNLITTRRPTPTREDYPFGAVSATVQVVGFGVSGSYSSILDWLGEVEAAFPYGRVESVIMRGRSNDIEMEIQLTFMIGITADGRTHASK